MIKDTDSDSSRQVFLQGDPDCVLWLQPNACPASLNERVIQFVREQAMNDPKYIPRKQVHDTKQAGVFHLGKAFHYRNHHFHETEIPPLFNELMEYAKELTQQEYDTVLFKVYGPGESLAKHQDVDGSPMNVACFTFATDPSQLCEVCWFRGSNSYVKRFSFTPAACSVWFMGGLTNAKYSHRVPPAEEPLSEGLRVSVSLRQNTVNVVNNKRS